MEPIHIGADVGTGREGDPSGEKQLAPLEIRGWVIQFGDVHAGELHPGISGDPHRLQTSTQSFTQLSQSNHGTPRSS